MSTDDKAGATADKQEKGTKPDPSLLVKHFPWDVSYKRKPNEHQVPLPGTHKPTLFHHHLSPFTPYKPPSSDWFKDTEEYKKGYRLH